MDGPGVGLPVVDLLDAAGVFPGGRYFTFGERRAQVGRRVRLGKAWMVGRLQALAQTGRVHPQTAEVEAAHQELLDYEVASERTVTTPSAHSRPAGTTIW